jgi:hypothetical protein
MDCVSFFLVISAPLLDVLASAASEQSPLPASIHSPLTTPLPSGSQVSSTPNVWPSAVESEPTNRSNFDNAGPLVTAVSDHDTPATTR